MIRIVYTFFTGVLLATFVGVGIAAFYPAPKAPEPPVELQYPMTKESEESEETRALRMKQDDAFKAYQAQFKVYARNVSISALVASLILMGIGLVAHERLSVIADGFLFGGLLTLLYSVGWGFATEDNKYRFVVVSVGLLVALALGYLKFVARLKPTRS